MKAAALVAWNLRRLRVKRGIAQDKLAAEADVDRSYMSRLEWGLENPTIKLLERLAKHLEAEMVDLFRTPAKNEPKPLSLPSGRRRK
jgi:transcriptional regulator with XRE-family HTH domain